MKIEDISRAILITVVTIYEIREQFEGYTDNRRNYI